MHKRNVILPRVAFLAICGTALATDGCGGHGLKTSARLDAGQGGRAADDASSSVDTTRAFGEDAGGDTSASWPKSDATVPDVLDDGKASSTGWALPTTGDPIWRSSKTPLCLPSATDSIDLWSSNRGVYVVDGSQGGLLFNNGTGWARPTPQPASRPYRLTGIPGGGALLLYGGLNCGVSIFDGQSEACAATLSNVYAVFAVDSQRIFAIVGDRLLTFNGTYFTQYGKPLPPNAGNGLYRLWADPQVVVVAADAGKVYLFEGSNQEPKTLAIPGGGDAWSVWGFAGNDLWVGDDTGRLAHYDGSAWSASQQAQGDCSAIENLWGADGTLFFATSTHVGRLIQGKADTVFDVPCSQRSDFGPAGTYEEVTIERLWGNSPTEVFIAARDWKMVVSETTTGYTITSVSPDDCSAWRVYWFDGRQLARL